MRNYKNLLAWQKGMDLVDEVYQIIGKLPGEERFALANQMRRAVASIPQNVSEGSSRSSLKDYRHFLEMAQGSAFEIQTTMEICLRRSYCTEDEARCVLELLEEEVKILTGLMKALDRETKEDRKGCGMEK